ncbi:ubiquitin carboxyl-terminal hydrolase 47-like isoform X2 [Oreochromis aureus]|uniref:ubiquitin carboxyl-terminal hydrolase 47-like isoform X2 n=1 Tax=Oreochromis aureus TaxID=47969 RepID=UPI001954C8AF|nr:ubiquitin carboxyl-terminal hydrolase 47-like isoform X2 [Oreochromis aureus]
MNHYLVSRFRKKLKSLPVADYHGLKSPGLTCYLNSVLQVLFMTENFRDALKSPDQQRASKEPPIVDPELRRLFDDLQKQLAETRKITEKLGITDVFEQRDAAEYFEKILCMTSQDASKMGARQLFCIQIFKGELNHRTTCCKCDTKNDSRSFFWILPLMMEDSRYKTYNLEQGLEAFFELQQVSGDDQIYCSRCDEKQNADIKWEITQHPDVLTLLLKRFTFDYKLRCYVKLHCKADVPQTLHLEKCTYELYAVVNHFGSLTGGHYTAEIKSYENGQWYSFNDGRVESVKLFFAKENPLRSSTAYILLYRKVSKEAPNTEGGDHDDQCALSDVKAEGRSREAHRGDADVPHYQPERYYDKGKDILKSFNGDLPKSCCDDEILGKLMNFSGEPDKQSNQRAAQINKTTDNRISIKADAQWLDSNTKTHVYPHISKTENVRTRKIHETQQNSNSQKKRQNAQDTFWEVRDNTDTKTGTKTSEPRIIPGRNREKPGETKAEEKKKEELKEASAREYSRPVRRGRNGSVSAADKRICSCYCCSVLNPTNHSKSHCTINEASNYKKSVNQGRNVNTLNSNIMKEQHVVTTDSKLKTKHKQQQTASMTEKKCVMKEPWK